MTAPERAYVSIVQWPDDFGEAERAGALVHALGMSPPDARLAARRDAPVVVARVDASRAQEIEDRLAETGLMGFVPTARDLASFTEPLRVKRMAVEAGVFVIEPWRGEAARFAVRDLRMIVKGAAVLSSTRVSSYGGSGARNAAAYMVGGIVAVAASASMGSGSVRSTREQRTEIIDLTFGGDQRVRFSSDKLSFDMLGESKGMTDRENMQRLGELLRFLAPRATFDDGFSGFSCPAEFVTGFQQVSDRSSLRVRSDAGAFDFYSAWIVLLARRFGG